MLKKAGILTVGVTAGLLAVAPVASAGVSDDHDKDRDKSHSKDRDHDKKKKKSDRHDDGDQRGTGNIKCDAEGGDLNNDASGGLAGQVAGPVLSGNTGQLLSCNAFLNDILNDNEVNVLSS